MLTGEDTIQLQKPVAKCTPGDRSYCHWMGVCNTDGSACLCDDVKHRSPKDQCKTWQQVITIPDLICTPGDRSYCNWMGVCNSTGESCLCDDPTHWKTADRCAAYHP